MVDALSTSERHNYATGGFHESTLLRWEQEYEADIKLLAHELSFCVGRSLACFGGNHFFKFGNGETSDMRLARELGCPYIGCSGYIILILEEKHGHSHAVKIFAHHGRGGGRTVGASMNPLEQAAAKFRADICLPEETQLLTTEGWKFIKDVSVGDSVFSSNNGIVETDTIQNIIFNKFSGDLIHFKNSNVDFRTTLDHRIMYRYFHQKYKRHGKYLYKNAEEFIKTKNIRLPLSAKSSNDKYDISDSILSIVGWIVSEGSFRRNKEGILTGIIITQKNKLKRKIIRDILESVSFKYSSWMSGELERFYISQKSCSTLEKYVSTKRLPLYVNKLNDNQFSVLLDALMLGDGNWCKRGECGTYYSADGVLIDQIQAACMIHGYRTIKKYKKGGFKNGGWVLYVSKRVDVSINSTRAISNKEYYSGNVWCVTTRNGNFFAREKGRPFITGNCLMGHDHQRGARQCPVLDIEQGKGGCWKIKEKNVLVARTGGFLKNFEPGKASYNVDQLYPPSSIGALKVILRPMRRGEDNRAIDNRWVDIEAIV